MSMGLLRRGAECPDGGPAEESVIYYKPPIQNRLGSLKSLRQAHWDHSRHYGKPTMTTYFTMGSTLNELPSQLQVRHT